MTEKKLMLSFKGNKKELHYQFKLLCVMNGTNMNARILDLIKGDIEKQELIDEKIKHETDTEMYEDDSILSEDQDE